MGGHQKHPGGAAQNFGVTQPRGLYRGQNPPPGPSKAGENPLKRWNTQTPNWGPFPEVPPPKTGGKTKGSHSQARTSKNIKGPPGFWAAGRVSKDPFCLPPWGSRFPKNQGATRGPNQAVKDSSSPGWNSPPLQTRGSPGPDWPWPTRETRWPPFPPLGKPWNPVGLPR